jgi:hypothetical protein
VADEAQVRLLKDKGVHTWNEWRRKNPRIRPDLSGVNLRKANLNLVDLNEANLNKANLRGAILSEADLAGARLMETDLSGADLFRADLNLAELIGANINSANLSGVNLGAANLSDANLCGANLFIVDLNSANITRTDFSDCIVSMVQFGNIDLSVCKGLDKVQHQGPSTIGIDTIYRSGGNIPEIFLRGAGVPEPFINYMKSLVAAMSPIEFYSCFISYSHADKTFAHRLHDALQEKGIRCWLDQHQLLPGDDIYHAVDRGIRLWDKMLLCCSEHSLQSWWVDNEIGTAFDKEQQLTKERGAKVQVLVPLNLDGYLFSDKWKSGYQAQVRRRLAADFTDIGDDAAKFDTQVERLIRALRADESARENPPIQRL